MAGKINVTKGAADRDLPLSLMLSMRISIALATYNGARFLEEQLASLARQTHLPAELVVCDDVSTDDTKAIVRAFSAKAPFPVRLIENERNLGWKDNFMKAASLCAGDWVAFCDQDDVWMPNKLERLRISADENPGVLLIVHAAMVTLEDLRPTGVHLPEIRRFRLANPLENAPWDTPAGFACCFRRTLIEGVPLDIRPHDPNWPEARLSHCKLVYLLANVWGQVAYLPEILVLYRRHGQSVTRAGQDFLLQRRWGASLHDHLRVGALEYQLLSRIAYECGDFFEDLAQFLPSRERASRRGALYYQKLAEILGLRAELYAASGIASRLSRFSTLVRKQAYSSSLAGLGLRAMTKDAALVILSPALGALRNPRQ